ncbi:adenylate kinase isoenzyme 5-like isoform X2 [Polyodon spathula]|uniref:adenylate kinase isoenzyme 5-like isoform X2 n=1 Tax=Polyodon spathula TaxID=7913 RepID=UPI001B7EF28A|nr:adenylate kinase isoenzyme 5-like isoform X2 [Polyodon spathula]
MNTSDAKEYLTLREIPQLFESLLTGLMYYRPDDPVEYMESCLKKVRDLGGTEKVRWDTFVCQEKKSLTPLNGGQSRRSFFRNGGPGSGKGTQSLKIAERYGFEYISVGELLRNKMFHNATSNRKWSLIAKIITNGELAPQETTITEIKQKLMQIPDAPGIIIDGFPRDVAQALSFEDQICTPDLVVFLACVNNRLKERLQRRAEQQGRPDDNPKATERRLANFKQNAIPLVKYFQEKGLIVTLDADRDEEEVFYDISVTVDNKLFPTKEPVAGPSELDLSLLVDSADTGSDFEEQAEDQTIYGDFNLDEELKKLKIIFVLGGPGSGKGTQCEKIEEKYGFTHLSTGDLLRSELLSDTERSRFIKDVLERGELVSMEIVLELVKEAMAASLDSTKGFLIDGFPRDVRQGEEFEMKIAEPSLVLFMDCSTETMTKRLQRRYQASPSTDSCRDTIRKRVDTFRQTIETVVTYYENRRLSHTINAEKTPAEVFLQVCTAINSVF